MYRNRVLVKERTRSVWLHLQWKTMDAGISAPVIAIIFDFKRQQVSHKILVLRYEI